MHKENEVADRYRLTRISDDAMLGRFKKGGYLIPLALNGSTYYYDSHSPAKYAYVRPYTRCFLERFSIQYHTGFHKRWKISSAVRPKKYHNRLMRRIANASKQSTHPTGATIDISKRGMNKKEIKWMRTVLSDLERRGYIQATEEWRQPTFHVMVFSTYPCARSGRK